MKNSADRVARNTPESINARIERETEARVAACAGAGHGAIAERLEQLDREWDIERALEALASSVILTGITLGARVHRRWFALPAVAAGFLLQHAVQGWCPPLLFLRPLGVRTREEIDRERYALKALRGDFDGVTGELEMRSPHEAFEAARRNAGPPRDIYLSG